MLRRWASVLRRPMVWLRPVSAAPIPACALAMTTMLLGSGLWFVRAAQGAADDVGLSRIREARALLTSIENEAICAPAERQAPIENRSPPQSTSKEETMKHALIVAGMIAIAGSALAYDAASTHEAKELTPEDLAYRDDPAFPKGAQTVVLQGDPKQPGLLVLRVKFPPNYVVPPHTHPGLETVTILSGSMGSGMGEKADLTKGKMLKAGSMLALPAKHAHYVWTGDEETIIQVAAIAPFDLTYINPADDPRKK